MDFDSVEFLNKPLEEQIKELDSDIQEKANELKKLTYQFNRLLNKDQIEKLDNAIGKYYRGKLDGMGTITLFKPRVVDTLNSICIKGHCHTLHYFKIGDVNYSYTNAYVISGKKFFDEYEEISKEEYNKLVKDIYSWCHLDNE